MTGATRQLHLQELRIAEAHVARGKKLVGRQQQIARHLRRVGGAALENAEIFLRLLEDTQYLFESHADLIKREIAEES